MALRWVKENIRSFNGDPEKVTIFGASSGGASVGLHLLSNMSKNLFHRAILQGGSPLCYWVVSPPKLQRKRTEAFATLAGCNFNNSREILECVQGLSTDLIIETQNKLFVRLITSIYSQKKVINKQVIKFL